MQIEFFEIPEGQGYESAGLLLLTDMDAVPRVEDDVKIGKAIYLVLRMRWILGTSHTHRVYA